MNLLLLFKLPHLRVFSNPKPLHLQTLKTQAFLSIPTKPQPLKLHSSSCSTHYYNGWYADPEQQPHTGSPESTHLLHNFLSSLGLADQKYVYVFVLGVVSALAVSRVRLPSLVVFPAGVLVFAVGFSLGFVRSGNGVEKIAKGRGFGELVKFFDEFDVKVGILKVGLSRAVEGGEVSLRDFVDGVEEVRVLGLTGRRAVEQFIQNLDDGGGESEKGGRKKKEVGRDGFGFSQFIRGLIGEIEGDIVRGDGKKGLDSVDGERGSVKSSDTRDLSDVKNVMGDPGQGSVMSGTSEKEGLKSVDDQSVGGREFRGGEDERRRVGEMIGNASRFVGREEYSYRSNRLQFVNESRVLSNMVDETESNMVGGRGNMRNSVDFGVGFERMESEASFVEEQRVKESSRVSESKYSWKNIDNEINRPESREEEVKFKDDFRVFDHQSVPKSDFDSYTSAASADDVAFDRYLAEASDLLKNAKEYVAVGHNEENAEVMLYKSADLLSKATSMKPMSLLAVGQLANTYLIHGELKLKTTRELRAILSGSKPLSVEKLDRVLKGIDDQVVTRNKVTSALIDVCEECEGLLIEAGRKYRLALSIDGSDVRALYNWGLALSYRAQLIADVGPEAALDADKIYLAAIDKFDAMLSRGNDHAPEALFKWGVALQQRSRLRPRNSKEKVKLLQQAKRLFEDALLMGSERVQVRDALLSCVSELKYRN